MITDKETLSNKIRDLKFGLYPYGIVNEDIIGIEDVKDFIKKLKERFPDNIHIEFSGREINNVILDLAGKELI